MRAAFLLSLWVMGQSLPTARAQHPPVAHLEPSVPQGFPSDIWSLALERESERVAARAPFTSGTLTLHTRLGRHGGEWIVELTWRSDEPGTTSGSVLARHTAIVPGDTNALLQNVATVVTASAQVLTARSEAEPPTTAPPATLGLPPLTLQTHEERPSFVLPLAAAGVAVTGVVVGAIFHALGNAQVQYTPLSQVAPQDGGRSALSLAVAANVAFGVAGLAALTGGVLLIVDYQTNEDAPLLPSSGASATLVVPF